MLLMSLSVRAGSVRRKPVIIHPQPMLDLSEPLVLLLVSTNPWGCSPTGQDSPNPGSAEQLQEHLA